MISIAKTRPERPRIDAGLPRGARSSHDLVPARGSLPGGLVLAGQFTGQLRAFLDARRLTGWDIFFLNGGHLADVDSCLAEIGEADAAWEPHPRDYNAGEQPGGLSDPAAGERIGGRPAGCLHLPEHEVVVARWFLFDMSNRAWMPVYLCAAPSPDRYHRLKEELIQIRRQNAQNVWQVVTGETWRDERIERDKRESWDSLILAPDVRRRLEGEVGNFFTEPVAGLYRDLNIPYRRGLLLYGPPGNGKTSLIRVIGNLNPAIPGLLLRPGESFDDNDLKAVIDRWREQAPSILVIEDLDWLFHSARLNVSTFLNMLDGVDQRDGGLLLIATSNNPECLDPAINNRPGRFDLAIEVKCPDAGMRAEFFRRGSLAGACGARGFDKLVSLSAGLSFSHLREIESQSGLSALQESRSSRSEQDVLRAAERVAHTHSEARRGFPAPAAPFGLGPMRGTRIAD
jgi:hypothetical protein